MNTKPNRTRSVADPAGRTESAAAHRHQPVGALFTGAERRLLLATPGIGLAVVERIERVGVHSLQQLRHLGVDSVVDRVCRDIGHPTWKGRRRALSRVLMQNGGI